MRWKLDDDNMSNEIWKGKLGVLLWFVIELYSWRQIMTCEGNIRTAHITVWSYGPIFYIRTRDISNTKQEYYPSTDTFGDPFYIN
jgi:hypothetical protein